ncbi:MAG: hypothetical protein UY89_C0007G0004 [Parcubacteria group bacterium GW2011_GWA1_54_9]|nr:MAG: hypothetical protein UY89_C0007G0004 [Parcubacteria group bacterium GW2011_GWA1_54_9]
MLTNTTRMTVIINNILERDNTNGSEENCLSGIEIRTIIAYTIMKTPGIKTIDGPSEF